MAPPSPLSDEDITLVQRDLPPSDDSFADRDYVPTAAGADNEDDDEPGDSLLMAAPAARASISAASIADAGSGAAEERADVQPPPGMMRRAVEEVVPSIAHQATAMAQNSLVQDSHIMIRLQLEQNQLTRQVNDLLQHNKTLLGQLLAASTSADPDSMPILSTVPSPSIPALHFQPMPQVWGFAGQPFAAQAHLSKFINLTPRDAEFLVHPPGAATDRSGHQTEEYHPDHVPLDTRFRSADPERGEPQAVVPVGLSPPRVAQKRAFTTQSASTSVPGTSRTGKKRSKPSDTSTEPRAGPASKRANQTRATETGRGKGDGKA
ncbi:hypothetical protein OC846_006763 [Tilletia horrida]|uniref:Uncharacterized protein n=1 Tax=Tilletia horrida TaxID=155126 RepID=A0AAN6GKT9_9BASI|nr:hypothetical protein OC846_006763 [Tilletia horrida]KAK0558722.1 hypothetical protein OC861_006845 [Tilletia horrida]